MTLKRTCTNPIGVLPRNIWEQKKTEERVCELKDAISRYIEANWPIPQPWVDELNEYLGTIPLSD